MTVTTIAQTSVTVHQTLARTSYVLTRFSFAGALLSQPCHRRGREDTHGSQSPGRGSCRASGKRRPPHGPACRGSGTHPPPLAHRCSAPLISIPASFPPVPPGGWTGEPSALSVCWWDDSLTHVKSDGNGERRHLKAPVEDV